MDVQAIINDLLQADSQQSWDAVLFKHTKNAREMAGLMVVVNELLALKKLQWQSIEATRERFVQDPKLEERLTFIRAATMPVPLGSAFGITDEDIRATMDDYVSNFQSLVDYKKIVHAANPDGCCDHLHHIFEVLPHLLLGHLALRERETDPHRQAMRDFAFCQTLESWNDELHRHHVTRAMSKMIANAVSAAARDKNGGLQD